TICIGAFVQVLDQKRQQNAFAKRDIVALADLLAERLDRIGLPTADTTVLVNRLQALLPTLIPSWGLVRGRQAIVVDSDGQLLARVPTNVQGPDAGFMLDLFTRQPAATAVPYTVVLDI